MKAKLLVPLLLGLSGSAEATLFDRGGGLLYDDVLNVTWLQDANYAQTSGYDDDGLMIGRIVERWAYDLVYHDSIRNVDYSDWRLTLNTPIYGIDFNDYYSITGNTDHGYNITSPHSELSYMYYINLGLKGYYSPSGAYQSDFGVFGNGTTNGVNQSSYGQYDVGLVKNLQASVYWSGPQYNEDVWWSFSTAYGYQSGRPGLSQSFAWAVRPGDVDASGALNWTSISTSAEWDEAANWDRLITPDATTDVVIPTLVYQTIHSPQHDVGINSLNMGQVALQIKTGYQFSLANDSRVAPRASSNHGIISNSGTLILGNASNDGTVDNTTILENLATNSIVGVLQAEISNDGTLINHATLSNGSASAGDTINSSTNLGNWGVLTNYGALNNYGHFINNGLVHNQGAFNNIGYFKNKFDFFNHGTIANTDNLINERDLYNYGTITNQGELRNNATLQNHGLITSSGLIRNTDRALNNHEDGIINLTAGTLENDSDIANAGKIIIDNGASITQTPGAIGDYVQDFSASTVVNGRLEQSLIDIRGGSLSGSGEVIGHTIIGVQASLNPGNSPGSLSILGDLDISGILNIQVAGLTSGLFDVVNVSGKTTFLAGSKVLFDFIDGYQPTDSFSVSFLNSANVDFGLASFGFLNPDFQKSHNWLVAFSPSGGLQLTINSAPAAVPLPGAVWFFGSGLLGLLGLKRSGAKHFSHAWRFA